MLYRNISYDGVYLDSTKDYARKDYFSMLEVYNEQVRDLLSKTRKRAGLKIREDQQQGFQVAGLKLVPCDIYARIESLMEEGTKMRTRAMTTMNATSSRSHVVITTQFQQIVLDEAITKQSVINPVAFVGSERQKSSGSERERLKEGMPVNLSLTTLGNVLSALAEAATGKRVLHIPSRDLLLTKLLPSALGGNSRTIMIAAVSPADICYEETLSTLPYAERYTFVISPSLVLVRIGVRCWAKRPKIPVQNPSASATQSYSLLPRSSLLPGHFPGPSAPSGGEAPIRRGQALPRPLSQSGPWLSDLVAAAAWLLAGVRSPRFNVSSTTSVLQGAELLSCAHERRPTNSPRLSQLRAGAAGVVLAGDLSAYLAYSPHRHSSYGHIAARQG
ncbi:kinesin-like protein KIF28P [Sarcoramphus papa]